MSSPVVGAKEKTHRKPLGPTILRSRRGSSDVFLVGTGGVLVVLVI